MFTASDVLLKAASRIEEEGMWCQRAWYGLSDTDICKMLPPQTPATIVNLATQIAAAGLRVPECAQGAIASSVIELVGHYDEELFEAADFQMFKWLNSDVPRYNDTDGRSAFEVAEAMRQAAFL